MEYQKIIDLLEKTPNQPTKFRTKNWVERNDDARGTYNKDSKIEFKTSMLKSSLCDYSDAYILVGGTITMDRAGAKDNNNDDNNAKLFDEVNKGLIFKNWVLFTDCISAYKQYSNR